YFLLSHESSPLDCDQNARTSYFLHSPHSVTDRHTRYRIPPIRALSFDSEIDVSGTAVFGQDGYVQKIGSGWNFLRHRLHVRDHMGHSRYPPHEIGRTRPLSHHLIQAGPEAVGER